MLLLAFSIALLTGFTFSKAVAQATITAKASAQVIAALTATETSELNFGRFSPETEGGQVILSPEGERTSQGTVVLANGAHNSASFYITGEYESTFSVTLPSGPAVLTNTLNSKTMQVSNWQSIPAPGVGVGKLVGGSMTVRVGAILNVGNMNANPVGIYTGIYAITFAYN